jgi:hypothetical protein
MPTARVDSAPGPVDLNDEDTGAGTPLVWCHGSSGDHESGRWGDWHRAGR